MKVNLPKYPKKGERKTKIIIEPHDTWNLCNDLALIIHPALVLLKEEKQGSPYISDDDVPDDLKAANAPPKEEWETDEFWHDRWQYVLDQMIFSFKCLAAEDDGMSQFITGEISLDTEAMKLPENHVAGMKQLVFKKSADYHYDREGHSAYLEKIQKGLVLFGKYFQSLWT